MHIGLDFGTTNTSAATIDGGRLRLIPLEPATNRHVLRSVLFISREGRRNALVRIGTDVMAMSFCPAWMIVSSV